VLVFSSACAHFASNGADGMNAALYHGLVTARSLPWLEEAAEMGRDGDDAGVFSAADLLREVYDGGGAP